MEENMEDKETNDGQKESKKDQNYDITLIETDFIESRPLDPMETVVDYD